MRIASESHKDEGVQDIELLLYNQNASITSKLSHPHRHDIFSRVTVNEQVQSNLRVRSQTYKTHDSPSGTYKNPLEHKDLDNIHEDIAE